MADYGTYCSIGRLKAEMRVTGTSDDAALLRVLETASRHWDAECGRHFYPVTRTVYLDGPAGHADRWQLWLPVDVLTVSSLKLDVDGDRTYETTLSGSDYELVSVRADQQAPYNRIDLKPSGARGSWPATRRSIELTGVLGFSDETEASGTLGEDLDASETDVTMTAGHGLTGGETVRADSEEMYVSAVSTNTLTVVRGVNGTTAATHSNGASVTRRRYARPIEAATALRAARLWRAGQSGFAGEVASPEVGGFAVASASRDEWVLVQPFRTRAY